MMEYRRLGRTGLQVSAIGLGTEYLKNRPRETVVSVVREAVERGVNYVDLIFSLPEYLDNLGVALRGLRERLILTAHLGSTAQDGQYCKTRSVKRCEVFFLDLLARLGTDYIDVLFLHNCDSPKDYDTIMRPNGPRGLAHRLQREGKARFIGFSSHTVTTALRAVESGHVDVLMYAVNLASHAVPGKTDLFKACITHDVGLVAMKPFAGGKLLKGPRTVRVARYQRGGEALKLTKSQPITPTQCLAYILAQPGVSTAVPGCQSVEQVQAALTYWEADEEERDFAELLVEFEQYVTGECIYCNHCLPCPAAIDVGQTIRLLEAAQGQPTAEFQAAYAELPNPASACTQCGACEERCPFDVRVISKMEQAAALFEALVPV